MSSLKILACGDVCGNFSTFFKKIDTVNSKSGPFEMVLCVGSFFSKDLSQKDSDVWNSIKSGKRLVPIPVYILGPNDESEKSHYSDLNGYEIVENLIYLGQQGCLTTKEGLRVAYASGSGEEGFKYDQYKIMEIQSKWNERNFNGVDILITSEWPYGIEKYSSRKVEGLSANETIGSKIISKLAMNIRPRYHFAGLHGFNFERQPYRNHRVLNEESKHVTRFISLSKLGNVEKRKWIYAFNIIPIKTINRAELIVQPSDVTETPYNRNEFENVGKEKQKQFFYDMNAQMEGADDNRKRKHEKGAKFDPKKMKQPCWFCLSGAEVEKHLIVSIGEHTYMALPKGGLTPEHVMILPISHHPSLLELPEDVYDEVEKFKSALKKCFKKQGKIVVFFERNYKSFHLQLQAVALPKEFKDTLKSSFLDIADSQNIQLLEIPEHADLKQMAQPGTPYFYVELPTKEKLYHRVRSGFPLQFGREVLASPSVLNREEAIDWRDCKVDKEEEAQLTKAFRTIFAKYDFTEEDNDD